MKILSDTKLYLSELGAKGFLYPSEKFITTSSDLEVEPVPFVYSKEHGLIPVRVAVKLGEDGLSNMAHTIFWVQK
jgi:hypothetical protein